MTCGEGVAIRGALVPRWAQPLPKEGLQQQQNTVKERERETHTHTDTHRDRQTDRQTDRQRETESETERYRQRQKEAQSERERDRETERERDAPTTNLIFGSAVGLGSLQSWLVFWLEKCLICFFFLAGSAFSSGL